jgi:hypothetical protein
MKRLIFACAAIAAVACSDNRERSVPVVEEPDRPLQIARPDTTDKTSSEVASRSGEPVSPVEQAKKPAPRKTHSAPRPRRPARQTPPPADTSSAQG